MLDERVHYFDNFRAVAISLIIMGHCYAGWNGTLLWEVAFRNAITGGTALFVFISGFFLHSVFASQFEYVTFIRKKFLNVVVPYFILSSMFMLTYYTIEGEVPFPSDFEISSDGYKFVINIITGRHLTAYWYIPFVFLLFLLSHLFLAFMKLSKHLQVALTVISFALASVAHRPVLEMNPLHSILYFSPFYLMGILFSQNKTVLEEELRSNYVFAGCVWVSFVFVMSALGQQGNLHKWLPWQYSGIDLFVLQKTLLIIFIISILLRFLNRPSPIFSFIASISFPLFFIHPWVLSALSFFELNNFVNHGFTNFVVVSIMVICISIGLAVSAKKVFGERSRFVIGA
jgi:hypothetical protein